MLGGGGSQGFGGLWDVVGSIPHPTDKVNGQKCLWRLSWATGMHAPFTQCEPMRAPSFSPPLQLGFRMSQPEIRCRLAMWERKASCIFWNSRLKQMPAALVRSMPCWVSCLSLFSSSFGSGRRGGVLKPFATLGLLFKRFGSGCRGGVLLRPCRGGVLPRAGRP